MFDKVIGYQDEKLELSRVLDTILNESKYSKNGAQKKTA
jgi:ATP-dependent Zn protease